jgi:Domain of unknown function (DUF4918)
MQMTRAAAIIAFNEQLAYDGPALPEGVHLMNPFRENPLVPALTRQFYARYYGDAAPRRLILGINPGRLGAGATGIPFTDTKRMRDFLDISAPVEVHTHEPSSVFVYDVIQAYGGPAAFYQDFYIHSVCPLGFTMAKPGGKEVNYNYYDDPQLTATMLPFIIWNIRQQIALAGRSDVCYCLGSGKNYAFLSKLNQREGFFERIVPLEHPRFVMQYRARSKAAYVDAWLAALRADER